MSLWCKADALQCPERGNHSDAPAFAVVAAVDANAVPTDHWPRLGRAVQDEPIEPVMKAPGSLLLKLRYDGPLANLASVSTCATTPRAADARRCGRA